MKKHNVVATLGTLALVANLLVPSLAFGQGTDNQTGSAQVNCGTVTFNRTPADFSFSTDAVGGAIEVPTSTLDVYSPVNGAGEAPEADKVLSVRDARDWHDTDCANGGFTVTVQVVDDVTPDGEYFASGVDGDENTIPLGDGGDDNYVLVATTGECEVATAGTECGTALSGASFTENAGAFGNFVHDAGNTQYQGDTPGLPFDLNSTDVSVNYAARATFTGETANFLGTAANTPSAARTLMSVPDNDAVFGEVGFVPVYSAQVPALQPTGTYVLNLEYTLTPVVHVP